MADINMNSESRESVSDHDNISNQSESESSLELSCSSSPFDEDDTEASGEENAIAPYQYEPYISASGSSSDGSDTDSDDQATDRLDNTNWCQCGNCAPMPSQREFVCCHEITRVTDVMQQVGPEVQCVTHHPGFEPVCLNEYVLETAYYQYRQQYRVEMGNSPERNRYTGYRQPARWIWGKDVRVILPACAVRSIRETFPTNNESYTGFNLRQQIEYVLLAK